MTDEKPRHLTSYETKNGTRYRFLPSKALRDAGFFSKTLGTDEAAAIAYVNEQNRKWDTIQSQAVDSNDGTINWLIGQFERDPTWYGDRAPRTREEIDYALRIINDSEFAPVMAKAIQRKHLRGYYNKLRVSGSPHKARKIMKWFHRLFEYAIELGLRDENPGSRLKMEKLPARDQVWTPQEVEQVVQAALNGGVAKSGNTIPPRPSVALAARLAYETSLPQQDILALTWTQYDGEGIQTGQQKTRGPRQSESKELWAALTPATIQWLNGLDRVSTHIIVSEETLMPFDDRRVFSRMFRRFRDRAGVRKELTFQDFRRTALTELGNSGGTNAEIVSISGHDINSKVLKTYVKPGKEAAKRAASKRFAKPESH